MSTPAEEVPPDPAALIESMRAFGYSLPTAIADLVDNSISAAAATIEVRFDWHGPESTAAVLDDGAGMGQAELIGAMRLGSHNPVEARATHDLGRFGLGLKSAAWSQGRGVTVITRHTGNDVLLRRWDLDHVAQTGRWELLSDAGAAARPLLAQIGERQHGTAVLIEKPDRLVGPAHVDDSAARIRFFHAVAQVRKHLGVVFHRFLVGREAITLTVNGEPVTPWDPFMESHPATQAMPRDHLWLGNSPVDISPFVLPHHSRLSEAEDELAAGPRGWTAQQGFYIYRARRLLVAGGWMGLPRMSRLDAVKLARIRVDLDNTVDELWQIDVRKATARIPGPLQPDMERIAHRSRDAAARVFRFRGMQEAREPGTPSALHFVWQSNRTRGGRSFTVNREHPVLAALRAQSPATRAAVDQALRLAEEHLPLEAIVLHAQEQPRDTHTPFDGDAREVTDILRSSVDAMVTAGTTALRAIDALANVEPFDDFPQVVQVLREEFENEH
jgi:hypothetical protein